MKRTVILAAILSSLVACQAGATIVTLKPYSGAGDTLATVYDTELSNYGVESLYNYGGKTSFTDLFQTARVYLVKFDLSAVPNLSQVTAINSATLRVYRLAYSFTNANLQVAQIGQDWVQGTGNGGWDGNCDGAQWFARNAGTTVPKASLVSDGGGIYHLNGVSNLANDPVTSGAYFVRMAGSPGNYNNAGQGGTYAPYASLAALQAAGATRGCFWDSANSRLYVNKNDYDVRWYSTSDLWTTAGASVVGSYIYDKAYPTAPAVPGWVEFNITAVAQNWIVGDQSNYGVRMIQPANAQNSIASSHYTTDPTLRPELVLDLQYGPPPTKPAIKLVPGSLSFAGHAADPLPATQGVTVQNSGVGTLNWTAAVRAPAPAWISVTNATGTDNGSFSVGVNWQAMSAGTYTAYVDVTDPNASNSPQTVTVTMQVLAPPQPALKLVPTSLSFTGHAADPAPAAQAVQVQNTGAGALNWTAAVRAPAPAWISLTSATGTDNGSFNVSVNWQGMAVGTYTAYVDVTDPNASNSPQTAIVTMQVLAPPQPTIHLVPASLTFAAKATDPAPAAQSVTVQNTGTAPLNWTAAVRAPIPAWITLTNPTGTDNGAFSVSVNLQGMTPGAYTAYVDVTDPTATNSPQTAAVTLQVRSQSPAATLSFTNTARGTHPNTLTLGSSTITVDLSSLPGGTTVYRAILVPHLGGNNGAYPGNDRTASPMQIASADAPGVWLAAAAPRYLTLDCTAAVQRAVLASPKALHLNVQSWPSWNTGQEFRLDVWCNVDAVNAIQQVTVIQAVHRSGDTMITFAEVNPPVTNPTPLGSDLNTAQASMDSPNEVRYRIYRSTSPIDSSNILTAELVNEIAPMSGWNWTFTPSDWNSATIPTLPVADLTSSAPGTGIYVRRAQATQSVYYGVSRSVNGEEDLGSWTTNQNCIVAAVAESAGTGMVLKWKTATPSSWDFVNNPTMNYYAKWECPPNYNVPSYAHNYLVVVPQNLANPCPVDVALHCWGGNYEGGYAWWYEAENGGILVATNEIPYDWWVGFHENAGTLRPWTNVDGNAGGVCRNYSQNRIWSFYHDFVATKWNVDPNHTFISGVSMGGSGSCQWGIRAGDKFSYIDSWVGVHIPRLTPTFVGSYQQVWGPDTLNCLFENTGLNVWDYWDDNQWLRAHVSTETPFVCFANGKNDAAIGWQQAWMFVKALQETRRPHLFVWGQDAHGQRAVLPGTLSDRYIGIDIDLNKTLPAFTYCSLDNNPGTGDPAVGDATGMLNGYMLWQPQDSTDTAGRWEETCLLIGSAPQATCTVDVTPRRCQAFKPAAGVLCGWSNTNVATGAVIAGDTASVDANGLVTLPQMTVTKTKNRLAIWIIADVNGDGSVDVVDLLYLVDAFGSVTGDANYDPACDFNSDGSVDVVDLLDLVYNFGL